MSSLLPEQLRQARSVARLTQQQAAHALGVSQPYLALLEHGRRPVTSSLHPRIVQLYRLGPTSLTLGTATVDSWDSPSLASALATLGYPGFAQLRGNHPHNPALVLLAAIATRDLEVRVIEALPWLSVQYHDLDWEWVIREAKLRDLQNRLGFIVTLARHIAENRIDDPAANRLGEVESILDRARLVREDTLCQASLSDAERLWLRQTRPPEAGHWNLLTDLTIQLLPYAA